MADGWFHQTICRELLESVRPTPVLEDAGREPTHDDVLAQVSFGTWRHLLPSGPNTINANGRAALWRIDQQRLPRPLT